MKFLEKEWKNKLYRLYIQKEAARLWIHYEGQTWLCESQIRKQTARKKTKLSQGLLFSALPGRIQKIFVKKGDKVEKGQSLVMMSAMKIEYNFKAEGRGIVEEIFCKEGQTINLNKELIKVKYL